jgi:hypothetical protein
VEYLGHVAREGLSEQTPHKRRRQLFQGRVFKVEETDGAKALRWGKKKK